MLTLWDEIELIVPAAERDEVKQLLGQQQVEENQALRDEYVALLDMSSSLQQQTEALTKQHSLLHTSERSLVEGHLHGLLSRLNSLTSPQSKQRYTASMHSTADQKLQKYVRCVQGRHNDTRIAASWDGSACNGSISSSRPASRLSVASSDSLQSVSGSVDLLPLNVVRNSLISMHRPAVSVSVKAEFQQALAAEHARLLADIDHIQACLIDDADAHAHAELSPPPLAALREYSTKLQNQLLEVEAQQLHEQRLLRVSQDLSTSDSTASRCSTPADDLQQSKNRSCVKRPDTAYEPDSQQHDASPAVQDMQQHADSIWEAGVLAAQAPQESHSSREMSSFVSGAGFVKSRQRMQQSQSIKHEIAACEPMLPNKSKQHSRASPKTKLLASKAWT